MQVVTRISELRSKRAALRVPIGLVPTMGALHAGHAALIERARKECLSLVVSVFVNPLQFGPREDFDAYPRNIDGDRKLLGTLDVDLLFLPDVAEMYPRKLDIFAEPTTLSHHLEGERRPGHFRGVATVVLKLFHIIEPQRAYFGEKDAQQLAVIKRMVSDLSLPIDMVSCPTLREADGLAISSRNAYLTAQERHAAPNLYAALQTLREQLESGQQDIAGAAAAARKLVPPLTEDYLAVVRPDEFRPLQTAPPCAELLAVGAAFAGRTRLIDNVKVQTPARGE